MRRLRLDPDALTVASFATDAATTTRGTVAAHAITQDNCTVTAADCQTNIIYCPSRVVSQCGCVTADTC